MKILHVVQNYYPSFGGTQYLFQRISEKLVASYGDDVSIYTTDSMLGPNNTIFIPIKKQAEEINGVKVKRFKFRRWHKSPIRFLLRANKYLKLHFTEKLLALKMGPWSTAMLNAMDDFDGDIICASSNGYLYMNYPVKQKRSKKIPFVYMGAIHFDDQAHIRLSPDTRKAINASDAYIANTVFEKQCLIELGIDEKKIFVIGCGVDINNLNPDRGVKFRNSRKLDTDIPLIGYIGRHAADKGIDTLIAAMDLVWKKKPDTRLLIAGAETDYSKELKQRIQQRDLSLQHKIIYLPNVSGELKADLFNACDIIVNASKSESFGIVYLEGWACKKPVIGCNIPAVKSLITEGVDGLLIHPNDHSQLAEYIQLLLCDKAMCRQMGEAGYNKIQQSYTWDIIAQKYREVYQYSINKIKTAKGA